MKTVPHLQEELKHRHPIVALVGPTAVGKSEVAIRVAQGLGTEVLTADSRQIYRGMDIGTDKPSMAERHGVPHRLIDLVDPDAPFNVGMFRRRALDEIDRLYGDEKMPLVVGGTGLYVRALLYGLWDGPAADWDFREQLEREANVDGNDHLHRALSRVDPMLAQRLHPHDRVKIIRALEVHHLCGRPLSELHQGHGFAEAHFTPCLIGLVRDREALYRRIDARVDVQLERGLVDETSRLLANGYGRQLGSMKGLGYRQMAGYLAGEYDYAEAVRVLKRDTRHFAKRQLTWFKKESHVTWVSIGEHETADQVAARILRVVEGFFRADKLTSIKLTNSPVSMSACEPVSSPSVGR
jgi:tRNA dimethylallyltransferase